MSWTPDPQTVDEQLVSDAPEVFAPLDLLPANRTPLEYALGMTSARILNADTQAVLRERNPRQCAAAFLPFLAWERSVHFYSGTGDAADRARTANSFDDHLCYGAPPALEHEIALDTAQDIEIVEFFQEPALQWPQFVVESWFDIGAPMPAVPPLWASGLYRRNVRDKLQSVRLCARQPVAEIAVGCAARVSLNVQILPVTPVTPIIPPAILVGAATRVTSIYRILPL
jgi:phage tail P2-like protein